SLLLYCYHPHRDLPSFPTRRSSDLDAPVSGGEVGAKNAALTIMVGASQAAFDRIKPIFELMGKNITLVGGNGAGQTCKVANQIIDRKSTRLNSSHVSISYAVFCLKK